MIAAVRGLVIALAVAGALLDGLILGGETGSVPRLGITLTSHLDSRSRTARRRSVRVCTAAIACGSLLRPMHGRRPHAFATASCISPNPTARS